MRSGSSPHTKPSLPLLLHNTVISQDPMDQYPILAGIMISETELPCSFVKKFVNIAII